MLKKCKLCLLTILFLSIGSYYALAQSTPKSHIETTIGDILKVLSDSSLKGSEQTKERRESVAKVIERGFDFSEMSRRTLGKHWKNLNNNEQSEFTRLFSRLIESSYIAKIDGYSDEKVAYLKERVKGKYAQVDTEIISKSVTIPIKYSLKQRNSVWRIYDVKVEGVSLVTNYKGQFGAILSKGSYKDLKVQLEKKLKNLEDADSAKS